MADQHRKPDTIELWFAKRIEDEIEKFFSSEELRPIAQQNKISVKDLLHSEVTRGKLEEIERNHKEFFQLPFDFEIVDPLKNNDRKMSLSSADSGCPPVFLHVSSEGLSVELRTDFQDQGIVVDDLHSLTQKNPTLVSEFLNENLLRNSITSSLIHAITSNAVVVVIPDHAEINEVIKIEFACASTGQIIPFHLIIRIGKNAKANFSINIKPARSKKSSNVLLLQNDFSLAENAELNIFRHQTTGENTLILMDDVIKQERNSKAVFLNIDEGAKGVSSKISLSLEGEGAESTVTGMYRPEQSSRYFYDTEQIHIASYTVSDLLYNGVIGESAYASWRGNIVINEGTRSTNGYQANNNLVIHESAKVESVPGLEIKTDDVKCSHGVTIGNIDKNHMFYLQSRGINKEAAEKLIINGFLQSPLHRSKTGVFNDQISTLFDN